MESYQGDIESEMFAPVGMRRPPGSIPGGEQPTQYEKDMGIGEFIATLAILGVARVAEVMGDLAARGLDNIQR